MTPDESDPSDRTPSVDAPDDGELGGADEAAGQTRVPDAAFVEVDIGDVGAVPAAIEGDPEVGRATAVVPKRSFCERCEHFADPPEVACTHDGTEIVEVVDTAHFRVIDCPVVARRREMGDLTSDATDTPD